MATTLAHRVVTARDRRAPLVLPGVYDALSARLAEAAGFEAIYLTGAGLANARFGVPDIGLVTLDGLVDHVAAIDDVVDAALVVDADTGFGNAVNVTHAVRRLERAGADAIQLEDQVMPKKCGHFAGKAVIDAEEMERKLQAALDARRSDDTLIIARTDARATHGLDAALERAERYRAAGADVIFVEAPTSTDELRAVAAAIDAPARGEHGRGRDDAAARSRRRSGRWATRSSCTPTPRFAAPSARSPAPTPSCARPARAPG